MLTVLFLAVLVLYYAVRPASAPAGPTQPAPGPTGTHFGGNGSDGPRPVLHTQPHAVCSQPDPVAEPVSHPEAEPIGLTIGHAACFGHTESVTIPAVHYARSVDVPGVRYPRSVDVPLEAIWKPSRSPGGAAG